MTSSDRSFPSFDIEASFVGDETILGLRGEIDVHAAPELGAYLDAMIGRGHLRIVLDLEELSFLDASGLSVIAGETIRIKLSGGSLAIRTPSALVAHLLEITGFAKMITIQQACKPWGHLGPEQFDIPVGLPDTVRIDELAEQLRAISSIPASDEVVDSALRLVVTLARATVGGADGVSVSLRRRGRLATVAASDQTILDMDAGQYATGEGPCVDASVEGRWFHAESLADETRWPDFVPKARALGINSILSSPLRAGEVPVGALNIYSRTAAAFGLRDQQLASTFATEASTILGDSGVHVPDQQLASKLGEVLRTREVISQAQGVLMERHGVGEHDAYTALRRFS
ncbi:MAG TPA: anti-sigma factor antagonist, partial [Acidimicrobiales bacterium]|nr:anti-sigma factor antagonist [Acidimicrobiales bacterium]